MPTQRKFFLPETAGEFDFTQYDYVIDAVDTVTAKLEIISICSRDNIPVISSMGTGNKLHPEMMQIPATRQALSFSLFSFPMSFSVL